MAAHVKPRNADAYRREIRAINRLSASIQLDSRLSAGLVHECQDALNRVSKLLTTAMRLAEEEERQGSSPRIKVS